MPRGIYRRKVTPFDRGKPIAAKDIHFPLADQAPPIELENHSELTRLRTKVMDLENSRDRLERIIDKLIENR